MWNWIRFKTQKYKFIQRTQAFWYLKIFKFIESSIKSSKHSDVAHRHLHPQIPHAHHVQTDLTCQFAILTYQSFFMKHITSPPPSKIYESTESLHLVSSSKICDTKTRYRMHRKRWISTRQKLSIRMHFSLKTIFDICILANKFITYSIRDVWDGEYISGFTF